MSQKKSLLTSFAFFVAFRSNPLRAKRPASPGRRRRFSIRNRYSCEGDGRGTDALCAHARQGPLRRLPVRRRRPWGPISIRDAGIALYPPVARDKRRRIEFCREPGSGLKILAKSLQVNTQSTEQPGRAPTPCLQAMHRPGRGRYRALLSARHDLVPAATGAAGVSTPIRSPNRG